MQQEDYPALYQAADKASIKAQTTFLNIIKWYVFLLIAGVLLSFIGINSKIPAIIAAIFFLFTIGLSILMATKQYQKIWYNSRAVAESVKTVTWRFIMKTEPYLGEISLNDVRSKFCTTLKNILDQNKQIAHEFDGELNKQECECTNGVTLISD